MDIADRLDDLAEVNLKLSKALLTQQDWIDELERRIKRLEENQGKPVVYGPGSPEKVKPIMGYCLRCQKYHPIPLMRKVDKGKYLCKACAASR